MDQSVEDNSNLHDCGIENAVDDCSVSKTIHRFCVVKSTELKVKIEETEKQIQRKNEDLFSITVNIDNKKLINYLDERKEEHMKVKENIEHLKKEIKVLEKDLSCLQMQQTKLYQRKYELNARIIDLRKRLDEVIGGARMSSNCKLLSLDRHGEVVAYAQTERKDHHAHHVKIGLGYSKVDCWEVSVIEPLVENFPLFLRGPVFFTPDDAVGSTIAWPIKHILYG